ncbi:MAG: peptidylprolyl isomerase [Sulfurimonadaceae bacterium]|jgi:parvulin-like peptidyl-prolyl isomerase|nr:peptidylprolyl isomerase [Sulfurimonadaceae bacterium]
MRRFMRVAVATMAFSVLANAQTLVTVNGTAITSEDVEKELMVATQGRAGQIPADKQGEFRQQVLEQLIARELVYDDAKKSGILESAEYKARYDEVMERIQKEVALQIWQKREIDKIKISQKDLKDYYDKNKVEFAEEESVNARHILVADEAAAKSLIAELKPLKGDELKNKFMELAKAKSTCASASDGGNLGYFTKEQMVPEFSNKSFGMKKGEMTLEPVKSQFGYHIIYVEDKKPKSTISFDDAKVMIEQRLKMDKAKDIIFSKMSELEKKATIKQQ